MRNFLTILLAGAAALSAGAAEPVFSYDFAGADQTSFDAWTVIDANNDEKTWQFNAGGTPSQVFYSYSSTNQGDDWLISPAINIPADGTYVLTYELKGSSYGEAFEVWAGNAATVEGMTEKLAAHTNFKDEIQGNLAFIDGKAGQMHLGFHCTSPADLFRLYIISVTLVEASNPVDLLVSEIVSPKDGEGLGQETVTVKITNNGRVAVDSYDVAYSLNGGEAVIEHSTVPVTIGESVEYSFATKADLSRGHFTHTLKAWTLHNDDINPANDATEVKVRHIAAAAVPYSTGFEPDEDTSGITYLNLNNDDGDWNVNIDSGWFGSFARTGYGSLTYNYNRNNAADDWAFLEPIEMGAGHYVLKYWYSATDGHKERLRVCYGNAPTPEAMTNELAVYDPMTNAKYEEAIHIFEIKEAGKVYFGFYAFSDPDENWICIDDLSLNAIDANASDLVLSEGATPTAYMMPNSSKDVAYTLYNIGIIDAEATVNFYLDGNKLKTVTNTVKAQQSLTLTETGLLSNITEGKHTLKIEAIYDKDLDNANNVIEKQLVVTGAPVALWDFEDNTLPSDLTFRVEDSATVHPNAGDEFNEDGFGIFKLTHWLLGSHALAVSTWFTEDRTADRWIVLPQMTVEGDACFVWNSNSFNPTYLEKYDVKVSKSEDNWYSYSTIDTFSDEPVSPQTHGIDLSSYQGENIYIALNVRTSSGEALILDNLGVYGAIKRVSTGIDNVAAKGEASVVVSAGSLRVVGCEATAVAVYGLDGALLAKAAGNEVEIAHLATGLYVAAIETANGPVAVKFTK